MTKKKCFFGDRPFGDAQGGQTKLRSFDFAQDDQKSAFLGIDPSAMLRAAKILAIFGRFCVDFCLKICYNFY